MPRQLVEALVLIALVSARAAAQCPDGTPPPCRTARAATGIAAPAMSVAVLSFENRSHDTTDSFLADGLADEIAAQLGGVERLTVRSRTMVRRLRGAEAMSVPELGRALGAAYLVNGSVQRAGPQLRVQVELLRASTGQQAWAQRYDQATADLFRVQSDVATAVSQAIAGRLLPQERAGLSRRPTSSNDAYQLYVRAVGLRSRSEPLPAVQQLIEQAIALDSTYAAAWALLSQVRMQRYFASEDRSAANLAAGRAAAERARRLAPDAPETHLALGYVAYWGSRDYAGAMVEFSAALRLRPGDADTWEAMGLIARRQGRMEEASQHLARAIAVDPANVRYLGDLWDTEVRLHRFDEAARILDSAEAHGMPAAGAASSRCFISALRADWAVARAACHRSLELAESDFSGASPGATLALLLDPDAPAAVDRLTRPDSTQLGDWYSLLCLRWLVAGDSARVHAYADSQVVQRAASLARDTTDVLARTNYADALSTAGRHADALRELDRAMREMPASRDVVANNGIQITLAFALARAGRSDEALDLFERLMQPPSLLTGPVLSLFPDLAPLRGNPRFQRLIAGP
jgi:TolB-like protein/Flp pilus assembly protein TadD